MNLFFGKISTKYDIQQISDGYYKSPRNSQWFGGIQIGDYAFIIGGGKIQFWQAREWGQKDGQDCLYFDIINADLGISIPQFIALKFLRLNKALIVLTSRSVKRAFFKLTLLEEKSIDYLSNSETYKDNSIYRKIIIHQSSKFIVPDALDIQLYYDNQILKLHSTDFFSPRVLHNFQDNLGYAGRGARNKDTTIKRIKAKTPNPSAVFTYQALSIRAFYDLLFCEYKVDQKYYLVGAYWNGSTPPDQTDRFLNESIWENGYDDNFLSEVKAIPEGSFIAIKTLDRKNDIMYIKALGEVVKNYNDGKLLDVAWEEEFEEFSLPFTSGYWSTIHEITRQDHIDAIWNYVKPEVSLPTSSIDDNTSIKKKPLNQIFFGPPGTGKTYYAIKEAIKIVSPEFNIHQEWDIIKTEYDRLTQEKQVIFTTFHQSMSYEDFVEGIKPLEPTEEGGNVIYKVEEGLFKQICKRANPVLGNFEVIIEAFKKEISEDDVNKNPITIKASGTTFDVTYRGTSVFYVKPHASTKENAWYPVNISHIEQVFSTNNYNNVYNQTYVREIIQYLIKNKGLQKGNQKSIAKNYVLIIDEINRGNVSSIFGELITLLEENKRQGKKESLELTLPFSKAPFSVPENLYIIGTMNTADKSVEALDSALRRRFSFTEMPPKPQVISNQVNKGTLSIGEQVIDLATILEAINQRIEVLLDRDHLIGHSYFLNINTPQELKMTFEKNIIPLLQEYFYGDYGKIALVLGQGFCTEEKIPDVNTLFANVPSYDTSMYQEQIKYTLRKIENDTDLLKAIQLLLKTKTE